MTAVVIDTGSGTVKAGKAGEDEPTVCFPSLVGRPKTAGSKDTFIGKAAQSKRDMLNLTCPVEKGLVTNWDDMEAIWRYVFDEALKLDPRGQPVVIPEPPLNPKPNRERAAQILFETFNVPSLSLPNEAVLSLFCSGRNNGIVMDSGEEATTIVPIYEGCAIPHAVTRLEFAGRNLTDYMRKLLVENGQSFASNASTDTICAIKEKLGYVAQYFDGEMKASASKYQEAYTLPDGKLVTIGTERFGCPEAMFQPSFLGVDSIGVHQAINDCINKCDQSIRKYLYVNTVLSGGNCMFPGMAERMQREITSLAPPGTRIKMITPIHPRKYLVWIGGSLLAGITTFHTMCIKKSDYDERGPSAVHQKTF